MSRDMTGKVTNGEVGDALDPKAQTCAPKDLLRCKGYIVRNTAGEGTYSKVKRACSVALKRDVAIKIINLDETPDVFRERFLPREMQILSIVRHTNIVETYEIFQTKIPARVYIVTEYLHGGDLLDHVKDKGAMVEVDARNVFRDVCRALQYLHANSIAHRDVKCENILLDRSIAPRPGIGFIAKLCDFGFARKFTAPTTEGGGFQNCSSTFCGSIQYASPEILERNLHDPMLGDVWALGIACYIALFGLMPFDESDIRKMISIQKQGDIVNRRFPKAGRRLRDFLSRALQPDPKRRPTIEALLRHRWLAEDTNASTV